MQSDLGERLLNDITRIYTQPPGMEEILKRTSVKEWDHHALQLRARLKRPLYSWTSSWDYERCFGYLILLDADIVPWDRWECIPPLLSDREQQDRAEIAAKLPARQEYLFLYVSALAPYYTFNHLSRLYDTPGRALPKRYIQRPEGDLDQFPEMRETITSFFNELDYTLLTHEWVQRQVPGVSLLLYPPEEVTVFRCLFIDFDIQEGEEILPPLP